MIERNVEDHHLPTVTQVHQAQAQVHLLPLHIEGKFPLK